MLLKDFAKLSDKQLRAMFPQRKCAVCNREFAPLNVETEELDGKPVCSGCYYDVIGAFVEECPIGHPRCLHMGSGGGD